MTKYKQLTLDDQLLIEAGLKEGNSFRGIGERIGKDCSTVSKEVRSHLVFNLDSRINMTRLAALLRVPHIYQPAWS